MKISIAPIQYFWNKKDVYAFYEQLQDAPVDIVYLGETVCSKRREMKLDDWMNIAERLAAAGKEAVLSSLGLFEAESELASLERIIDNRNYPVEANDIGAVQLLAGGDPFVIGPHINAYNHKTLALLNDMGAKRWVIPVELGRETIAKIQIQRPAGMETELFAYGKLPLAFSARCFSARAHNKPKDQCEFICAEYEEGLTLSTQQEQAFLVMNGIQIQSAQTNNLIMYLHELTEMDIDIFRITPQAKGMTEVISIIRQTLDGDLSTETAFTELLQHQSFGSCDGYWNGQSGMDRLKAGIPTNV